MAEPPLGQGKLATVQRTLTPRLPHHSLRPRRTKPSAVPWLRCLVRAEERLRRLGPFPSRPEAGSLQAGRTLLRRGCLRAHAARSPAAARRCRRPRRQTGQEQVLVEWPASPPVVTAVQVEKRPRPAVPRTVWTPARQRA